MATKAVATRDDEPAEVVPEETSEVRSFLQEYLSTARPEVKVGADAVNQLILNDILSAQSPDDVLTERVIEDANMYVGRNMMLTGFQPAESKFESGGLYAVLVLVDPEVGTRHFVTCGHQQVVAAAMSLDLMGQYPYPVKIKQAANTNQYGNYPLYLIKGDV